MMSNEHMINHQQPTKVWVSGMLAYFKHKGQDPWLIEVALAALASLLIGVLFAAYARGGPNSSDITMYMNIGMNGIRMPFVLNRYFNIFMQQIFIELAAHPLKGYHAYWGFIMGMTTFLIYISGRKALVSSSVIHGVLAVLIFYSIPILSDLSGVIMVDLPAMTVMTAIFAAYILSSDQDHTNPWLIGLLGLLLYLAFKTKETTLPIGIVFIGLGWAKDTDFKWQNFLKHLIWLMCGLLVGILVFSLLSTLFLGDPFFGLRPSEWQEYTATYAAYSSNVLATLNALGDGVLDDWYQGYWFAFTLLPFLLYLVSGITEGRKANLPRKVLWLVPLAFTVLMIITINNRLGYEERFGMPALPMVCALAPQFIKIKQPKEKTGRINFWAATAIGLGVVLGIRVLLRLIIPTLGYDLGSVILLVYYPLLITLLFTLLIFFQDRWLWHLANILILFSLLLAPIASNYRAMFVVRENEATFNKVVLPLAEFEDLIIFTPEMRFYASGFAFEASELRMVKSVDELTVLFNVYFDASASHMNFTYADRPQNVANDLLAEKFDYALLALNDWASIQQNETLLEQVLEHYQPHICQSNQFVFLVLQS